MNYQKIHDILIDRARSRDYDSKIHHNHHIIPLHEDPNSTEVVPLTYKEHTVIHHLRWKITGTLGNKLAYLRFKGMTEEFHREKARSGGLSGGKKTKELAHGIFSEDHDRSSETARRWKEGIITTEKLKITSEIARERGLLSAASGKGIYAEDYDRSQANKDMWAMMDAVERARRSELNKKMAKLGGLAAKEKKSGIHGLSEEERRKNCSKGGKAHLGKRWMNKDGERAKVPKELISQYLENGWVFGLIFNGDNK